MTAEELIKVYLALPFRFSSSLANPIRQYRRGKLQEQAFQLCLHVPDLPTVKKFYKECGAFCLPHFAALEKQGFELEHFDYCYGLALGSNRKIENAKSRMSARFRRLNPTT